MHRRVKLLASARSRGSGVLALAPSSSGVAGLILGRLLGRQHQVADAHLGLPVTGRVDRRNTDVPRPRSWPTDCASSFSRSASTPVGVDPVARNRRPPPPGRFRRCRTSRSAPATCCTPPRSRSSRRRGFTRPAPKRCAGVHLSRKSARARPSWASWSFTRCFFDVAGDRTVASIKPDHPSRGSSPESSCRTARTSRGGVLWTTGPVDNAAGHN